MVKIFVETHVKSLVVTCLFTTELLQQEVQTPDWLRVP